MRPVTISTMLPSLGGIPGLDEPISNHTDGLIPTIPLHPPGRLMRQAERFSSYLPYGTVMPEKTNLDRLEERDLEDIEPALLAVGYELQPSNMRPSVWRFTAGESNNWHRHESQEELYIVLEGTGELELEDETWSLKEGDFVVLEPETWRQFTATSDCMLLAIGSPSEAHDAILE